MNRNVSRNITVSENSINRLNELVSEADKRIKILSDMEKQGAALTELNNRVYEQTAAEKAYARNRRVRIDEIKPDSSIVLTEKGGKGVKENSSQKSLFDQENYSVEKPAQVTVTDDGASYAEIPVVSPKVYRSETPLRVTRKDDLKTRILKLYDMGNSVEDIAAELSCSTTEVQFALVLENRI